MGKKLENKDLKDIISEFKEHLEVDKQRSESTVDNHLRYAERILNSSKKYPPKVKDIRRFLKEYDTGNKQTYENMIKTVRVFTKFLGIPQVGKRFDYPKIPHSPKKIHSDEQIKKMYYAFDRKIDQAFYLVLASSGLRYGEASSLKIDDVNLETGLLTPKSRSTEKRAYYTFVNDEALNDLKEVSPDSGKIFKQYKSKTHYRWEKARSKLDFHITPKDLRDWFADKMGRLGVSDRYIDAFCGRVPQSVLANNYTDYSPEKLREIYEGAGLKVLE